MLGYASELEDERSYFMKSATLLLFLMNFRTLVSSIETVSYLRKKIIIYLIIIIFNIISLVR